MRTYEELLREVLERGSQRDDRTGTGTLALFGRQVRFDLRDGFPIVTTKKVHFKSVVVELLWFLQGRTDVGWLQERGVSIWDEWATPEACASAARAPGDLGPIYGHQWRRFGGRQRQGGQHLGAQQVERQQRDSDRESRQDREGSGVEQPKHSMHVPADGPRGGEGIDQIRAVLSELRTNPSSRRLVVSAWNPADLPRMALPPCHVLFQFYVDKGRLSCQLYQRSADLFLGVPFNIASYALLTHMVAQVSGLDVGEFVHTFGDLHLYRNHIEQARLQLSREPRSLPRLRLAGEIDDLFAFGPEHVRLEGYDPHPAIRAPVAV